MPRSLRPAASRAPASRAPQARLDPVIADTHCDPRPRKECIGLRAPAHRISVPDRAGSGRTRRGAVEGPARRVCATNTAFALTPFTIDSHPIHTRFSPDLHPIRT